MRSVIERFSKNTKQFSSYFPLVLIVIIAIIMRAYFVTGLIRADDFNYSKLAYDLAKGNFRPDIFNISGAAFRVGLYAPTALFYRLFGVNNTTTLIWPFLCSLLSIIFIFCIGKILGDHSTGLIAALLWAFFPPDILYATDLLSDGPMVTMILGSIFFFLKFQKPGSKSRALYFWSCCFTSAFAFLIKPFAIVVILLFGFYYLFQYAKRKFGQFQEIEIRIIMKRIIVLLIILSSIFIIINSKIYKNTGYSPFFHLLPYTAFDLIEVLLTVPQYSFILPLTVFSIIYLSINNELDEFLILWFFIFFMIIEWMSVYPNPMRYYPLNKFEDYRLYFMIFPPMIILSASYISKAATNIKGPFFNYILIFCVLFLIIILSTGLQVQALSRITFTLFILLSFLLPLFRLTSLNRPILFFFVLLIVLVSYDLSKYQLSIMGCRRSSFFLYKDVNTYINDSSLKMISVFPNQSREATFLEYYSRFGKIDQNKIIIQQDDNPQDGYVLISSEKKPGNLSLDNWVEVANFKKLKDELCQRDISISIYKVN